MINKLRGFARLLLFAIWAMYYVSRYLLKAVFTGTDVDRGIRLRKQFTREILNWMGVEIEVSGELPQGGGLLVCNHRSYVDPFLLLRDVKAMPVGKAEVAKWPIIGIAGRVSGAIFVDRSSPESRQQARQDIAAAVNDGYFIINYAEGTTHDSPFTLDFKPGMFRAAAQDGFAIYPVALDYQQSSDYWIGDDTFIRHFIDCFGNARTKVKVHYGPAIRGTDANLLIQETKTYIDQSLASIRHNWFIDDK